MSKITFPGGNGGTGGGGVSDHGGLAGLGDDDHTQYVPVDGSRGVAGLLVTSGGISSPSSGVGSEVHGRNAIASGFGDIVIGSGARTANSTNGLAIAIGHEILADDGYGWGVLIGYNATNVSSAAAVGIGYQVTCSGGNSTALGTLASATDNAVGIGRDGHADGNQSIAIGRDANARSTATDSIIIGFRADGYANGAIAIGRDTVASGTDSIAIGQGADSRGTNSIALGANVVTSNDNELRIGATSIVPSGSGVTDLGSAALPFRSGYIGSVVLYAPNGSGWTLSVDNNGILTTTGPI